VHILTEMMFKWFVLIFVTALCNAEENDYFAEMKKMRESLNYDSSSNNDGYSNDKSFSNDGYSNDQSSLNYGNYGDIERDLYANVYTKRSVDVRPLETQSYNKPQEQYINVPADQTPVTIHFRTQGTLVRVKQSHTPSRKTEVERTKSEEEPSRVVHEVLKPVIQEVREIIQPYRRIIQQIRPVVEQVKTSVAQAQRSYSSNNRYYSSPTNYNNNDLSYGSSDKYSSNGVQYGSGKMSKGLVYSSSENIMSREGVPIYRSKSNNGKSRDWRQSFI